MMETKVWPFLFGAALCFGLAWLNLGAHRWQLDLSLIPFGGVLLVAGLSVYRNRKRKADGSD